MNRAIHFLVLHTTATPASWTPERLMQYFLRDLRWSAPGYHIVITPDGLAHSIWPEERLANGIRPFTDPAGRRLSNANSLHVAWIGGLDRRRQPTDNRTAAQITALEETVRGLLTRFPHLAILGHNQIAAKACPCFHVPAFGRQIGLPPANIYTQDRFGLLRRHEGRPVAANPTDCGHRAGLA